MADIGLENDKITALQNPDNKVKQTVDTGTVKQTADTSKVIKRDKKAIKAKRTGHDERLETRNARLAKEAEIAAQKAKADKAAKEAARKTAHALKQKTKYDKKKLAAQKLRADIEAKKTEAVQRLNSPKQRSAVELQIEQRDAPIITQVQSPPQVQPVESRPVVATPQPSPQAHPAEPQPVVDIAHTAISTPQPVTVTAQPAVSQPVVAPVHTATPPQQAVHATSPDPVFTTKERLAQGALLLGTVALAAVSVVTGFAAPLGLVSTAIDMARIAPQFEKFNRTRVGRALKFASDVLFTKPVGRIFKLTIGALAVAGIGVATGGIGPAIALGFSAGSMAYNIGREVFMLQKTRALETQVKSMHAIEVAKEAAEHHAISALKNMGINIPQPVVAQPQQIVIDEVHPKSKLVTFMQSSVKYAVESAASLAHAFIGGGFLEQAMTSIVAMGGAGKDAEMRLQTAAEQKAMKREILQAGGKIPCNQEKLTMQEKAHKKRTEALIALANEAPKLTKDVVQKRFDMIEKTLHEDLQKEPEKKSLGSRIFSTIKQLGKDILETHKPDISDPRAIFAKNPDDPKYNRIDDAATRIEEAKKEIEEHYKHFSAHTAHSSTPTQQTTHTAPTQQTTHTAPNISTAPQHHVSTAIEQKVMALQHKLQHHNAVNHMATAAAHSSAAHSPVQKPAIPIAQEAEILKSKIVQHANAAHATQTLSTESLPNAKTKSRGGGRGL